MGKWPHSVCSIASEPSHAHHADANISFTSSVYVSSMVRLYKIQCINAEMVRRKLTDSVKIANV